MDVIDLNIRVQNFLNEAVRKTIRGNYTDALRDLKDAYDLDAQNPVILYNMGICYIGLKQYGNSIKHFETILELSQGFVDANTVRKLLSYCLILTGDLNRALTILNKCIDVMPNDIVALSMMGYCNEKNGNPQAAMDIYERITDIDPYNYNASNSMAYILASEGGDLNRALEYARRAVEARPDNPAYLDTLGFVYMKKNKPDMAKKYLKKALSLFPESEDIKNHINRLLKIGNE